MICCLDLEGVLVPEIWIKVAEKTGIRDLRLTTRDVPNYDLLMKRRLGILAEHQITLADIQKIIQSVEPLPGARKFLDALRNKRQVFILSDTYYEFAMPLMKKLGHPTLLCNWLSVDSSGCIADYHLRQKNGKEKAVLAFKKMGFQVMAAGDSYNDIAMLEAADEGIFFNPPDKIVQEFPDFEVTRSYKELLRELLT